MCHCPSEQQRHAEAPCWMPFFGSTCPSHGPHAFCISFTRSQVVTPSLQMPRLRFTRRPVQHAAVLPISSHAHPGLFLSSGHSAVPPGGGGGFGPPFGPRSEEHTSELQSQ